MLLFGVICTTMRGTIHNNALNVQLLVIATCTAKSETAEPAKLATVSRPIRYVPCL